MVTLGEGCHASHQPSDASTPTNGVTLQTENIFYNNDDDDVILQETFPIILSFLLSHLAVNMLSGSRVSPYRHKVMMGWL